MNVTIERGTENQIAEKSNHNENQTLLRRLYWLNTRKTVTSDAVVLVLSTQWLSNYACLSCSEFN